MPGNVFVQEAPGQPQSPGAADFTLIFVGPSANNPVLSGQITPPYSDPSAAAADLGASDMCDALMQAITQTPGNPAPTPAYAYVTPATTPGSYPSINVTAVKGTCVPAFNTAVTPKGTYEPWMQIVQGGSVGVTGMTAWASLNAGRFKQLVQLGTSAEYNFPASDGWPCGGQQCGFVLGPPSSTLSALYTALNAGRTALLAHFIIVSGSPQIHAVADTTDNTTLTAITTASTPSTAIALYNGLVSTLMKHGANVGGGYHTTPDAVLATALAALTYPAVSVEDVELNLEALRVAYEAHRILVGAGPVHGSADSTNTWAAYSTPTAPTLLAGDLFFGPPTTPPSWADGDLYTAGPPATGAFAAIADSGIAAAVVVLTEPIASADFATIVAGMNYCASRGKRLLFLGRFRDPGATEDDPTYITAWQVFRPNFLDNRFAVCAGSCWLSDSFSGFVYLRSFLAALCARWQSFVAVPGQEGERLAQNAGWRNRGTLEGASLIDGNSNLVGHDEAQRGGIVATPGAPTGGGIALYYSRNAQRPGTFVDNRATVMYTVGSEILLPQDRRVANAIEQVVQGIALDEIGGADITSALNVTPVLLDGDIVDALGAKMSAAVSTNYSREIQNATDPGLVVVNSIVSVAGGQVTTTATVKARFYNYTDTVNIVVVATR
jgi:hypothetical protein